MNNPSRSDRYEKWKFLIAEQERSGLSQKAFCLQRGLSPAKMTYYRSVLKVQENSTSKNNSCLTPIKIKTSIPSPVAHDIKITLPNGFCCEIPAAVGASHIKSLIEVLLSC